MLRALAFLPLLLLPADPGGPIFLTVSVLPCAVGATTCRVIASWTAGANYNAATDSTRTVWRNTALAPTTNPLRRKYTDGTADTLTVPAPPVGTPLTIKLDICTLRTGFTDPACAPSVTFPIEAQGEPPQAPTGVQVAPASATIRQDQTLDLTASPL